MAGPALRLPIVSERLVLRDLRPDDFEAMHAYASNAEVTRFLFWGPNTPDDTKISLDTFIAAQGERPRTVYELGLTPPGSDALAGALCLYLGDRELRNDAEIGFVLHPAFWGRGYVTEAARALMGAGFRELGLHRIWATCDARNLASIRVLEKTGMRREGTFRSRRRTPDGWVDDLSYAVLADDFV